MTSASVFDSPAHPTQGKVVDVVDCLGRSVIRVPEPRPAGATCIATVASAGYDAFLDHFLGSLRRHGECPDATVVVFVVGGDRRCAEVAHKHGALQIDCVPLTRINTAVKSVLYSIAEILQAERYLCIDADMLVLESLRPVFDALDELPDDAILCCAEGDRPYHRDLAHALIGIYHGQSSDFELLGGGSNGEEDYGLVVNEGLFAGKRRAMQGLAETMRAMPNASAWIDARNDNWWRSQFVFNLALARRKCGVQLDPAYNVQLHVQDIEVRAIAADRVRAYSRGQPVRVLHFNGSGRAKLESYRTLIDEASRC